MILMFSMFPGNFSVCGFVFQTDEHNKMLQTKLLFLKNGVFPKNISREKKVDFSLKLFLDTIGLRGKIIAREKKWIFCKNCF